MDWMSNRRNPNCAWMFSSIFTKCIGPPAVQNNRGSRWLTYSEPRRRKPIPYVKEMGFTSSSCPSWNIPSTAALLGLPGHGLRVHQSLNPQQLMRIDEFHRRTASAGSSIGASCFPLQDALPAWLLRWRAHRNAELMDPRAAFTRTGNALTSITAMARSVVFPVAVLSSGSSLSSR